MIPSQNFDSKKVIGSGTKYDPAQIFTKEETTFFSLYFHFSFAPNVMNKLKS